MNKIEVKGAVKKFGPVGALDNLSFNVGEGEIVGLLGPSGCGKTTILRAIAGLEKIDRGEILIDGNVVTSPLKGIFIPPEKRKLALVFQNYALWPHMTVYQQLRYCIESLKLKGKDERERIISALKSVGLAEYGDRYPSQLSGGQQQRIALARSMIYEPKVLLLDEPLSNLDRIVREHTRSELRRALRQLNVTSIYVTHDQEEAFMICDRVILMNHGSIVQEGTPFEICEEPVDSFAAEFVGRTNVFNAMVIGEAWQNNLVRIKVPALDTELVCNLNKTRPRSEGAPLLVAVRCSRVEISESPFGSQENMMKGKIGEREYGGEFTDYKILVGNGDIEARVPSSFDPKGKLVYVRIPPDSIKVLAR